jgi:hypothetical protein
MTQQLVPLWKNPTKSVTVETDATVGATVGVNLRYSDGSLVKATDFGGGSGSSFTLNVAYALFVPLVRTINTTSPLAGGGALSSNLTLSHNDTAVTPGTYTSANITVDQKGHVTFAEDGSGGGGSSYFPSGW